MLLLGMPRTPAARHDRRSAPRPTPHPALVAWLAVVHDEDGWTPRRERAAARALDRAGAAGVAALAAHFRASSDHGLRWTLVRCASELTDASAGGFLREVVGATRPPVVDDLALRMQALRGLARRAGSDPAAVDAIAEACGDPHRAIRLAAVSIASALPPSQRRSPRAAESFARAAAEFAGMSVREMAAHPLAREVRSAA